MRGCLKQSGGNWVLSADNGQSVNLQGDSSVLKPHDGHQVQVQGTRGSDGSLQVSSVNMISDSCTSNQASSTAPADANAAAATTGAAAGAAGSSSDANANAPAATTSSPAGASSESASAPVNPPATSDQSASTSASTTASIELMQTQMLRPQLPAARQAHLLRAPVLR